MYNTHAAAGSTVSAQKEADCDNAIRRPALRHRPIDDGDTHADRPTNSHLAHTLRRPTRVVMPFCLSVGSFVAHAWADVGGGLPRRSLGPH